MKLSKDEIIKKENAKKFKTFGKKLNIKFPRRKEKTMWIIGQSIDQVSTLLWDGQSRVGVTTKALEKYTVK